MILWCTPISVTELQKPLELPVMGAIKLSLFVLMRQLWEAPKDGGLVASRTYLVIRELELLVPPWFPGRGEGLEVESKVSGHWFNQTYLCDEATLKTQRMGFGELQGWWTCRDSGRVGPWRKHGNSIPFLHHVPMHLFHLDVTELQPFVIKQLCSK